MEKDFFSISEFLMRMFYCIEYISKVTSDQLRQSDEIFGCKINVKKINIS